MEIGTQEAGHEDCSLIGLEGLESFEGLEGISRNKKF